MKSPAMMIADSAGVRVPKALRSIAVTGAESGKYVKICTMGARVPGFGPVLAAEFLGATGGDLTVFQTADRFAGVVGLAPAPRDSGRISGNHHRPRRYDRRLLRVFYLSGLSALKSCPASRSYYDRKRREGKTHIQAMLSLARRRLNVLWAMLRDGTTYTCTRVPVPAARFAA